MKFDGTAVTSVQNFWVHEFNHRSKASYTKVSAQTRRVVSNDRKDSALTKTLFINSPLKKRAITSVHRHSWNAIKTSNVQIANAQDGENSASPDLKPGSHAHYKGTSTEPEICCAKHLSPINTIIATLCTGARYMQKKAHPSTISFQKFHNPSSTIPTPDSGDMQSSFVYPKTNSQLYLRRVYAV